MQYLARKGAHIKLKKNMMLQFKVEIIKYLDGSFRVI